MNKEKLKKKKTLQKMFHPGVFLLCLFYSLTKNTQKENHKDHFYNLKILANFLT